MSIARFTTAAAAAGRENGGERVKQNPNNSHLHLTPLGNQTPRIGTLRETSAVDHSAPCTLHHFFCF
ncbi:hypothetical protein PS2_005040 [Malus domestica]